MNLRKSLLGIFALILVGSAVPALARSGDDWQPITPEELAMKDYAPRPGALAVVLYREAIENDVDAHEDHYYRIKILTEEGKKYADIETPPFLAGAFNIGNIKARVIQPDGTIQDFHGKIFDKVAVKKHGVKMLTKNFTLPDVQVGSIIEYRYSIKWDSYWVYPTRWLLESDLPTRKAHFAFKPSPEFACGWIWRNVANKVQPVQQKDKSITLDLTDIPAFEKEELMPPENEVRAQVEFFYQNSEIKKTEDYWKEQGKLWRSQAEDFMKKRGGVEREAASIVQGANTAEEKLHKLYTRVQQMTNLNYTTEEQDAKAKRKENQNAEDVVKNGYGYHNQLVRTFVALARAAGMDATLAKVAERDDTFFHKEYQKTSQLTRELAIVQGNGKELYLDPGSPYAPFGLLPWEATGAGGLRIDKDGTSFVQTPNGTATEAITQRTAKLAIDQRGTLTGTVNLSLVGQEAMERRLSERDSDDAEKKKSMEDELKGWLPSNAKVELQRVNDWKAAESPLTADFKITIPGFAAATGRRMLMPASVFQASNAALFQHARRQHPVYFEHSYIERDDITLSLPEGVEMEGVPAPRADDRGVVAYNLKVEKQAGVIHEQRELKVDGIIFATKYWDALRDFYAKVKAGDEEQTVLRAGQ